MIVRPTQDELFERIKLALQSSAGITQFHESSVAGLFARVMASVLNEVYDVLEQLERDHSISTAEGLALDRIGQMFGVLRRPARRASTFGAAQPVKFTNTSTSPVTVPAGTLVWSSRFPGRRYTTVENITVPAGGEAYVHVIAEGYGSFYNAGVGEIDAHNGPSQALVTNVAPLANASDEESDDDYRARILQAFGRRYFGSAAAITAALEEIDGVASVRLLPLHRGAGTLDVVVTPVTLPIEPDLMADIERVLAEEVVPGIDWRLYIPDPVPVDVVVKLRLQSGWDEAVAASANAVIRAYIDSLQPGTELIVNEILNRVMDISSDVIDAAVEVYVDGVRVARSTGFTVFQSPRSRRVDIEPL